METDLIPNVRGNVQNLRNMWSTKVQEEQKLLKPKATVYRSQVQVPRTILPKQSIKIENQSSIYNDETIINHRETKVKFEDNETIINQNELTIKFEDDQKLLDFKPVEKISSIESNDTNDFEPLPPPPPATIAFKEQAHNISIMKQSVTKMFDLEKKSISFSDGKTNGIHRWHITRHVFRSGLIFVPSRRASDSIIPILMKTHIAQVRSRTDSIDSNYTDTPFAVLIDYITYNNKDDDEEQQQMNISNDKRILKRTISEAGTCLQRNRLNDTIAQYEIIMRHLKNYDKFMAEYPKSSPKPMKRKLTDIPRIEENFLTQKSSIQHRQTQSLARNIGRTFTEFVMNDLLSTQTNESQRLSTVHTASQTDLTEIIKKIDAIPIEDTKAVLHELDTAINSIIKEPPITPNSEINVIVINSPVIPEVKNEIKQKDKPLMQRLFEGKKTAYSPNDLQMETIRIPEELMVTFEGAKEKCFFPTEQVLYATKMIKIDRRGYKQHVRILCLTSERVYIITKKNPYPKEAVLFKDILGIAVTPRKDGFICMHTRETREDRGDWIFVVDHPCEFLTQLFMAMGRTHNNDHFLKIRAKFQHTRRNIATITDECVIESRPSDIFSIAFENYDVLVIYAP